MGGKMGRFREFMASKLCTLMIHERSGLLLDDLRTSLVMYVPDRLLSFPADVITFCDEATGNKDLHALRAPNQLYS
jgi:hypothetical protein